VNSHGMQELPASIDATLAELRNVLSSVAPDSPLQQRLLRTLTELERAIESMGSLLRTLDDKPSSVIFSREAPRDPEPQAGSK
jgi:paraquat-inducible protein B